MQKMQVLMKYGKVLGEGLMSLSELYGTIDDVFESCGIVKGDRGFFLGNDDGDEEKFSMAIEKLRGIEWFCPNVKVWTWEKDGSSEDLIAKYCR